MFSRQVVRLPRICLLTSPIRCMAKKLRPSKADEVERASTGMPGSETLKDDQPLTTGRTQGSNRKGFDGCIVKFHRDPDDMIPPLQELVATHPEVYTGTYMMRALGPDDVGKFVSIEESVKSIPLVFRATFADPFLMTGPYLLLRQTMFDIIQVLGEIDEGGPVSAKGSSIGVHGQRGGGKTALLNMLAVFALQHSRDWLLIATRGEEFMLDLLGGLKPSKTRAGVFNQGRNARAYFQNLMETQADKLKKITLKRQYNYPWINIALLNSGATIVGEEAREGAVVPTTLYGLLEQAVYDVELAADIFYDFVEEINLCTEYKTLVLIDNINVWDHMSEFRDPANAHNRIMARNLSMINALQKFQTVGPSNGLSVFCMTSNGTLNMGKKHMKEATYTMEQKIYSNDELLTAYRHYKASKMLKSELNPFLMARVKGLTGCVPRDAFFDAALI